MFTAPTPRLGDRSLFPTLEARAYLNHGGISPASAPVRAAVLAIAEDYARRGAAAFGAWNEQRARLRGLLARLVGAGAPEDIALGTNTTRGLTDIALCVPWRAGDRVILFDGEFPANVTPWQRAAAVFGLETAFVPLAPFHASDEAGLDALARELGRGGARLVAVSAVQFQTGLRMPLARIAALCRQHGAELCVDAVQAVGAVPLDVAALGIDYLACGSHKWLMGLEGAGFVYVSPARVAALRPTVAGWLSHEEGLRFLFEGAGHLRYDRPIRKRADFLEGGNYNSAGLAALEASAGLIHAIGVPAVHAHVNAYHNALEPELLARGFTSARAREPSRRSCTLSVLPPPGVALGALYRELTARGVACATPDGYLRFTPHWPNALDEVPFVVGAVDGALAAAR